MGCPESEKTGSSLSLSLRAGPLPKEHPSSRGTLAPQRDPILSIQRRGMSHPSQGMSWDPATSPHAVPSSLGPCHMPVPAGTISPCHVPSLTSTHAIPTGGDPHHVRTETLTCLNPTGTPTQSHIPTGRCTSPFLHRDPAFSPRGHSAVPIPTGTACPHTQCYPHSDPVMSPLRAPFFPSPQCPHCPHSIRTVPTVSPSPQAGRAGLWRRL